MMVVRTVGQGEWWWLRSGAGVAMIETMSGWEEFYCLDYISISNLCNSQAILCGRASVALIWREKEKDASGIFLLLLFQYKN